MPTFDVNERMEKTLSILTLVFFQIVTVVLPVAVIPVALINVGAPKSILSGDIEALVLVLIQGVFLAGILTKKKGKRLLLKLLGFLGMIGTLLALLSIGDRGGEIGSGNSQVLAFTFCTAIPFLITGVGLFIAALETEDKVDPVEADNSYSPPENPKNQLDT